MVFLPKWNTQAYIDKNGSVCIQLIPGQYLTKEEFKEWVKGSGYPSFLSGIFVNKRERKHFMDIRMELFEDVQKYYDELTKK